MSLKLVYGYKRHVPSYQTILIVDDHDAHDSLQQVIESRGLAAVHARSAEEAIRLVESERDICAIVLGLNMPFDGETALRNLRDHAAWRDIPMVLVTGTPAEELARVLGVPPYHCFSESVDPDRLLEILCQQCGVRVEAALSGSGKVATVLS